MKRLLSLFCLLPLMGWAQPSQGPFPINVPPTVAQLTTSIQSPGLIIRGNNGGGAYSPPTNNFRPPTNFFASIQFQLTNGTTEILVLHSNATQTAWFNTNNNNQARGQFLVNVINDATAADGDVMFLSPGTYDMTGTITNMQGLYPVDLGNNFTFNYGSSLVGAGRHQTVLVANGAMVGLGGRSSMRDLTLINNDVSAATFSDEGVDSTASTNTPHYFVNIDSYSPVDCFVISSITSYSYYLLYCNWYGAFDIFANAAGNNSSNMLVSFGCNYIIDSKSAIGGAAPQNYARVGYARMAKNNYVYNDYVSCKNGTLGSFGIYSDVDGSASYVYNTAIYVSGSPTNQVIRNDSGTSTNFVNYDCFMNITNIGTTGITKFMWSTNFSGAKFP